MTEITKDSLLAYGMKETEGDEALLFPLKKIISVGANDDSDEDDEENYQDDEGELAICLTQMRNAPELCLMMPDGACLYLSIGNIEELEAFEKCVESWEANY